MAALSLRGPPVISEELFFKDYILNTTKIQIDNADGAYVYVSNNKRPSYFFRTNNTINFRNKLKQLDGPSTIVEAKPKENFNNLMALLFFAFLLNRGRMGMGGLRGGLSGSFTVVKDIKTRLSDIAGYKSNKESILEFVDMIKNGDRYKAMGARLPRGAIFHGPPGSGKTLMARAIAGECQVPFISVSGSEFNELYVGVGAARVRGLFAKARELAPCILFIDEVDALAKVRGGLQCSNKETDATLNQLLVEMDGFREVTGVSVIAATNRLDVIDKALLRPGRFDRKIRFRLPCRREREEIFSYYLSKIKSEQGLEDEANILSQQGTGFSGADIENICNEAALSAVRDQSSEVMSKHLEEAADTVILGRKDVNLCLSENERKLVAYHEAGHAGVAYIYEHAAPPVKVSIIPREKGALGFSMNEASEKSLWCKEELLDKLCVLLGGRAAEEIFCETATTGACDDMQKAMSLARDYITRYGLGTRKMADLCFDKETQSDKHRVQADDAVEALIQTSYRRVLTTLRKHEGKIQQLAKQLLDLGTVGRSDIERIFVN